MGRARNRKSIHTQICKNYHIAEGRCLCPKEPSEVEKEMTSAGITDELEQQSAEDVVVRETTSDRHDDSTYPRI